MSHPLGGLIGSIMCCWFPDSDSPNQPGSKFRPVLVLDIDHQSKAIQVAYGTSQDVHRLDRGQIAFTVSEVNGLSQPTKFSLMATRWLPLKNEYFSRTDSVSQFKIIGRIPSNRVRDIVRAIEESNVKY